MAGNLIIRNASELSGDVVAIRTYCTLCSEISCALYDLESHLLTGNRYLQYHLDIAYEPIHPRCPQQWRLSGRESPRIFVNSCEILLISRT